MVVAVHIFKTKPVNALELESPRPDEDLVEDYEMSKEEILDSIERGFRQMLAGEGRPVLELLDELDNE